MRSQVPRHPLAQFIIARIWHVVWLTGTALLLVGFVVLRGERSGGAATVTLPSKIVGGYWQMWEGPKVSDVTASGRGYDLHYAAFAMGSDSSGHVSFNPVFSSGAELKNDITASKAAGAIWLLSIGGGSDATIRLQDETQATNMFNSLTTIIDTYGFQGIDLDIECGSSCWNPTAAVSLVGKLKAQYGSSFVISAAPRPYEARSAGAIYMQFATQAGSQLDLFGLQFYDFPEARNTSQLTSIIDSDLDTVIGLGIPASKILIGCITYPSYAYGWNTVDVYKTIYQQQAVKHPGLRGVFMWELSLDKLESWNFATTMGNALGTMPVDPAPDPGPTPGPAPSGDTAGQAGGSSSASSGTTTTSGGSKSTASTAPPSLSNLSIAPSPAEVGQRATVRWSVSSGSVCTVSYGGTTASATGTSWVTPVFTSRGAKTYIVDCQNDSKKHATSAVSVKIVDPAAVPQKPQFSASKVSVVSGSRATLSWYSMGASSCALDPGGVTVNGPAGSYTTAPLTQGQTYALHCSNAAGSVDAPPITVGVGADDNGSPAVVYFAADKAKITSGTTATLSWVASGIPVSGCALADTPAIPVGASGIWTTPVLNQSTSYTLRCRNAAGATTERSVQIQVDDQQLASAPQGRTAEDSDYDTSEMLTTVDGVSIYNGAVATSVSGKIVLDPSLVTTSSFQQTVSYVEYYDGDSLFWTAKTAPFAAETARLDNGPHAITARVYYKDSSWSEATRMLEVANVAAVTPQSPQASQQSSGALPMIMTAVFAGGALLFGSIVVRARYLHHRHAARVEQMHTSVIAGPPRTG